MGAGSRTGTVDAARTRGCRRVVFALCLLALGAALAAPSAQAATTSLVSLSSTGGQMHNPFGGWPFLDPTVSADGRFVAFGTAANDLVPGDTNPIEDVFVRDRRTGATTRESVSSEGLQASGGSFQPSISADGRYVAFKSYAPNLVAGDGNGMPDAFVRDRLAGTTERVSVRDNGTGAGAAGRETWEPRISADGAVVVFMSDAPDLVAGDTNNAFDVFAYDRAMRRIQRVSTTSAGQGLALAATHPDVSGDGRYVVFESPAAFAAVTPADADGEMDVFLKDRTTGTTSLMSADATGRNTTGWSGRPTISDDGSVVAFESNATLLVGADANGTVKDVFAKNRVGGDITIVS